MNKYFIPTVVKANGVDVPSTPFKDYSGEDIYLGDVIRIAMNDEGVHSIEHNLVELIDGVYVGTNKDKSIITEMYIFETKSITNLGSSELKPELLELLSI